MRSCFLPGDILLPQNTPLEKWAVIACDQHTSEAHYWSAVSDLVGGELSALSYVRPEGSAGDAFESRELQQLNYRQNGFFKIYPNTFVYVERQLQNGLLRRGVVGLIDLECYFTDGTLCGIMPTEHTDDSRLRQRIYDRENMSIELSHTMLLCDDPMDTLIGWVTSIRDKLPQIYDFQLMLGGGRITGWLLDGIWCDSFLKRLGDYCAMGDLPRFAVGDGNHSVAAAKACYQDDPLNELARYTMAELINIHDPAIVFWPIHYLVKDCDASKLLSHLNTSCASGEVSISWYAGNNRGKICVDAAVQPAAVLQELLDHFLNHNPGALDYIHGDDTLMSLASKENTVGFLMPVLDKSLLFPYISKGNMLPRKSFSIGLDSEKRYYLEGRKIK